MIESFVILGLVIFAVVGIIYLSKDKLDSMVDELFDDMK